MVIILIIMHSIINPFLSSTNKSSLVSSVPDIKDPDTNTGYLSQDPTEHCNIDPGIFPENIEING